MSTALVPRSSLRACCRPRPTRPPGVGHFRVAIDTAAGNADYSQTGARDDYIILQSLPGAADAAPEGRQPEPQGRSIYKNLSGMMRARPVGQRLHRRDHPGRRRAPRVVPAQHERPALHLSGLRLDLGGRRRQRPPTSRSGPTTCSPSWATRTAGTASSWTTRTRAWGTTTTPARVAKYPTDAAYQAATGSALAAIGARFEGRRQARDPELRLLEGLPAPSSTRWLQLRRRRHEREVRQGRAARPPSATSTERRCARPSSTRSRTPRPQGKLYLGVSHSAATDGAAARFGYASDAAGGQRQRAVRVPRPTTPTRTGCPSTSTRSARPPAAETKDASGVHRRKFSNGLVLVNPTATRRPRRLRRHLHRLRPDRRDLRLRGRPQRARAGQGRWWRALSRRRAGRGRPTARQ